MEEMMDVLEVLYAICNARGYTQETLEVKRQEKKAECGGFEKRLFLEYVEDEEADKVGGIFNL